MNHSDNNGKPIANRRKFLKLGSGAVALSIPVAAVALRAELDPDAALLALIDEHGRLETVLCDAIRAREDAEFAARDEFPERPPILMQRQSYLSTDGVSHVTHVTKTREMIESTRALDVRLDWHNRPAWRARYEDEIAALDAHEADCARVEAWHGVPRLEAAERAVAQKVTETLRRIYAMPARTPQGVLRKLLLADEYEEFRETAGDDRNHYAAPRLVSSAITDLEQMTGGAA